MTTPFDLGMDRMVSFSPDLDYLGRDALQRVAEAPPRRLKTLRLEAGELPEAGSSVTRDGAVVGTLTSPTNSPRFGPIALAIMKSAAADERHRRAGRRIDGDGCRAVDLRPGEG